MATFQVEISDHHLAMLQAHVQRYNQNTGRDLTVLQWVKLHLKDVVLAGQVQAGSGRRREEADVAEAKELQEDVDRLRASLD